MNLIFEKNRIKYRVLLKRRIRILMTTGPWLNDMSTDRLERMLREVRSMKLPKPQPEQMRMKFTFN